VVAAACGWTDGDEQAERERESRPIDPPSQKIMDVCTKQYVTVCFVLLQGRGGVVVVVVSIARAARDDGRTDGEAGTDIEETSERQETRDG